MLSKTTLTDEIHDDVETPWNTSRSETHRVKLVYAYASRPSPPSPERPREKLDPKLRPKSAVDANGQICLIGAPAPRPR